jgi:hypothetical protein
MGFGQSYQNLGVKEFYTQIGQDYVNPHAQDIQTLLRPWIKPRQTYLDLGGGDGLASQVIIQQGGLVTGCDPFLAKLYHQKTGQNCLTLSFEDIAQGKLTTHFDSVVCSYSLHLLSSSFLPQFLYQISQLTKELIILTPHKRPAINWYFTQKYQEKLNKTTIKIYSSSGI